MRFTPKLLPSRSGNVGVLMLNNAKALNALTLDMIHCMDDVLNEWLNNNPKDPPKVILLKSNTQDAKMPSFCAGGDVKAVYQAALSEWKEGKNVGQGVEGLLSADFFRYEYNVNHRLATLSTSSLPCTAAADEKTQDDPTVLSFWDGLVMGGGVGISIYGKYRIATERTVWAMPETGIGLFPDVGSLYWMPRLLPMDLAVYLALTGRRLKAYDLLATGLATHYVPSKELPALEAALMEATLDKKTDDGETVSTNNTIDSIAPVLMSFHQDVPAPKEFSLLQDRDAIQQSFGKALQQQNCRVSDLLASLPTDTDFGRHTAATLSKMSPTSCAITLAGLYKGAAAATLAEDLQTEFRLAQACLRPPPQQQQQQQDGGNPKPDFYEGIRAALVDKDQKPQWQPQPPPQEQETYYFGPIENEWQMPETTKAAKL